MTKSKLFPFLSLFCANFGVQSCLSTSKNQVIPQTGPCVLNDDGMKCTEKGYYETVQCDANGCFCVAAHNGFIAFDTRTDSNKIAPKCSNCHNALKSLFAAGDPPANTFVPKCDTALGNYLPMQCDSKQVWCYCVDPVTGKELPNTRKRKEKNQRINCDSTEFSIDPAHFPTTEESKQQERYPVGKESCKLDRNRGRTCNNTKPSVRYFFDYKTFSCLAFEYLGCGGNENNYRTTSECDSDCKLLDLSGCSGMYPAARGLNGEAITCGPPQMAMGFPPGFVPPSTTPLPKSAPKLNEDGCPKDHKCVMGAFFGFCCSKANEDRFNAAYNPTCKNGRQPYSEMRSGWRQIRFGKSCRDNFCPSGYICQDGDIFSYCC